MAEIAEPQMEAEKDAQGNTTLEQDKAGNVVLTKAEGSSIAKPIDETTNWVPYVSSDTVGKYTQMTDRWLRIRDFQWSTGYGPDSTLVALQLPKDAIINSMYKSCDIPNTIPFKVHRYCRLDMEIKIQINSNKFQIGQLQGSWFYQPYMDNDFKLRQNIYTASQTDHVLISAGASNEGVLYIPYRYHLPLMPTQKRVDNYDRLLMGSFYLRVLNKLSIPTGGPNVCYGSIFVRFVNSSFTGQISGKLFTEFEEETGETAEGQMDRIITGAISGAVSAMAPNMDNIQDTRNSQYVVPVAAHSWSYGTGISEPLQALRLNPRGMTHHPDNINEETHVSFIASKYGLVTTVTWSKNNSQGQLLFSCNAAPIIERKLYSIVESTNLTTAKLYRLPPIAVVSSLFQQWRGSIKFRFDIVASQFHTGRLLIGYVPGATDKDSITIDMIMAGPHMVFTLQEDHQFVYEIPYIADRPFWSRQYTGNFSEDAVLAPSRIYVFVLNPLIPMSQVVDKIYINIYMAGGSSFEVAVPAQPCIGVGYNNIVVLDKHEIITSIDGSLYYPGKWHSFESSMYLTMRSGTLSDQVQYFDTKFLNKSSYDKDTGKVICYYYRLVDDTTAGKAKVQWERDLVPLVWSILIWADEAHTKAIMVPLLTELKAKTAASNYTRSVSYNRDFIVADDTTQNTWYTGTPLWAAKVYEWVVPPPHVITEEDFDRIELADVEGEREEDRNVVITGYSLKSTGFGSMLYGENFGDLKDLLRRYQFYARFAIDVNTQTQYGQNVCNIPLLYQGLDLDLGTSDNILELSNRCREGHIPVILSGYRYARGSMRMRIILPTTKNLIAWVQHKPDRTLRTKRITICNNPDSANCITNHTYASFIQDCGVNSILQLELPYYKNGAYIFLQNGKIMGVDENFYCTLGDLSLGLMYAKPDETKLENYNISVYYSMADDFNPSVFQGFPPMLLLDDIENAVPQMDYAEELFPDNEITNWCAEPQMFKRLINKVTDTASEGIAEKIDEVVTDKVIPAVTSEIEKFKESLSNTSFKDLLNTSILRTIISQVSHCIVNFNIKSIGIAIVTIIIEFGMCTLEASKKILQYVTDVLKSFKFKDNRSGNEPKQPDVVNIAEEACAQMEENMQNNAALGLITILWTGICSLFTLKKTPPTSFGNLHNLLLKDIPACLKSANVIFIFTRNILLVWDALKYKVMGYVSPVYRSALKLDESQAEIKAWAQEVVLLDDPVKFHNEKFLMEYKARVHVAYTRGKLYQMNAADLQDQKIVKIITDLYKKIYTLREKMIQFGDDGYVRKEPFVLWQYGKPGIGKSTLTHNLVMEMLTSRNEVITGPPIYNHSSVSDFWDTCCNNPAMVVDDIFNVQEGEILQKQLALLFMVVSPVVLSPPKARLEEKGTFYNPLIAVFNSNYEFPVFNNVSSAAIHRRRHMLVKYEASNKKVVGCPHCKGVPLADVDSAWLKDFHHIVFYIHKDPTNEAAGYGPPMEWKDFRDLVCVKYNNVMTKNEQMHRDRMHEIMGCINAHSIDILNPERQMKATENKILRQQQEKYKEIFQTSILGSLKQMYTASGTVAKKSMTKLMLYMCSLSPHKKGLLDNISVDHTVAVETPKGQMTTSDYITMCYDELANGQIDEAYSVVDYNYYNISKYMQEHSIFMREAGSYNPENIHGEHNEILMLAQVLNLHPNEVIKYCCLQNISEPNYFHTLTNLLDLAKLRVKSIDSRFPNIKEKQVFFFRNLIKTYSNLEDDVLCDWTKVAGNQQELMLAGYKKCKHLDFNNLENVMYDYKKGYLYLNNERFDLPCYFKKDGRNHDRFDCPWSSLLYQHLFFESYKLNHPEYEMYADIPTYVYKVPPQFRKLEHVAADEIDRAFGVLQKVKDTAIIAAYNITRLGATMWNMIKRITDFLIDFSFIIVPTLMVGGLAGLTVWSLNEQEKRDTRILQTCKGKDWGEYEPQAPSYELKNNVNLNAKVPVAQAQADIPQFEVALDRLRNNMIVLTAIYDNKILRCYGPVLHDRQVLLLRHFLEEFDSLPVTTQYYCKFAHRLKQQEGTYGVNINFKDLKRQQYNIQTHEGNYASNLVLMTLPLQIPACKSLIPFIATEKDHELCNGDGVLYGNNNFIHSNLHITRERNRPITIKATETTSKVVLQDLYSYRIQGKGMCGSILLSRNLEKPIIGIHVAGIERGNVRGLAEPLVYETFAKIKNNPKTQYSDVVIPVLDSVEFSKVDINSLIYPVGCVDSKYAAHHIGKTQIIPSLIHGVFPVRTEPGPLSKLDKRLPEGSMPMEDGIAHKGKPPKDFNIKDLEEAAEDLLNIYKSNVRPLRSSVSVVDYQTAICGLKGINGYEMLEMSTSPGFPLRFIRDDPHVIGKRWLFDLEERDNDVPLLKSIHPKLKNQLTIEHNMRLNNIKPFTVFIDCLKDTTMPIEKCCIKGKTRIFSVSPVQFTIEFKRYFLDFMAAYQEARLTAEHGIGMDVNSVEWTDLASKLLNKGNKIICGDYKNYGPGLMLAAAWQAFEIIFAWYEFHGDGANNSVRRIMAAEIINGYYLVENMVYTTPSGIPSGSPITTPLNSIVGSLYIRIAWKYTTNLSYSVMHENISMFTYGDDVIIGVNDNIIDLFNTTTLSVFFSKYNITFTDADKSGNIVDYRDILSSSFLKCVFAHHPTREGLFIAQLDKVSIEGCANWIKKKNNHLEATKENCTQVLELAHGHGKEYYNYVKDSLIKAMNEIGESFRVTSWEEMDDRRYSQLEHAIVC